MADEYNKIEEQKKSWVLAGMAATLIIVLTIPLYLFKTLYWSDPLSGKSISFQPAFIGRESCKDCHKPEYDKWQNSHHDKAMHTADQKTVLGNFNNFSFTHNGTVTRFFKKDDRFFINTTGPDGKLTDFQITHTFGFYPLQQYLVPFPGGRMQCLTIAWDDIKKEWYALPNHTDDYTDWLHWTKQGQNWNGMCAECHSTNLKKGYDIKTDEFKTTFSEIDVSCEACHGPASLHVQWAETPAMARKRTKNYRLTIKTRNLNSKEMLKTCARCHSRSASIDDFSHEHQNLMDYIIPSLLTTNLYYPDGQIQDEVYIYGSFTQSKMFQRDVKCSDCHDVHSQKLKKGGNDLCLTCHRADTYDTEDHHFHKRKYQGKESKGDDCIQCHMPETNYMGIDQRADHSIRIPRPDLSVKYQTPNSCNSQGCHSEKSAQWSNGMMKKWYGIRKRPHYAGVISDGRNGNPDALKGLITLSKDMLSPVIVRATALSLLRSYPAKESYDALEHALSDQEPLVRQTAISTINLLRFDKNARLMFPLLYDPVKAVRIQAALGVASIKNLRLTQDQKKVFNRGTEEYIKTMEYTSDFPSGVYNLGLLYDALGQTEKSIHHYKRAIEKDNQFYPAKNNLAMLYNSIGKNEEAEVLFKQILKDQPHLYEISYSLGLLLVEEKKYQDAVVYLKSAVGGLPERARIHYNLGLLLQFLKRTSEAEKALSKALSLEPDNFDFLYAIADHFIKTRDLDKADMAAGKIIELYPDNQLGYEIRKYIKNTRGKKESD